MRRVIDYSEFNDELDTISTEQNFQICADAFSPLGSTDEELKLMGLLSIEVFGRNDERNVTATAGLAYTTLGEAFSKHSIDFPAIKRHLNFGEIYQSTIRLPIIAQGKISAANLVYRVDETPADAHETPMMEAEKGVGGPDLTNSHWQWME
ncbi:hypothetical protein NHQ30_002711 [Ciborinia camelliae]|nr:hypothetical protein NHQ30_002711 [Ciborinia camelliae]